MCAISVEYQQIITKEINPQKKNTTNVWYLIGKNGQIMRKNIMKI